MLWNIVTTYKADCGIRQSEVDLLEAAFGSYIRESGRISVLDVPKVLRDFGSPLTSDAQHVVASQVVTIFPETVDFANMKRIVALRLQQEFVLAKAKLEESTAAKDDLSWSDVIPFFEVELFGPPEPGSQKTTHAGAQVNTQKHRELFGPPEPGSHKTTHAGAQVHAQKHRMPNPTAEEFTEERFNKSAVEFMARERATRRNNYGFTLPERSHIARVFEEHSQRMDHIPKLSIQVPIEAVCVGLGNDQLIRLHIRRLIETEKKDSFAIDDTLRLVANVHDTPVIDYMSKLKKSMDKLDYSKDDVASFHELFLVADVNRVGSLRYEEVESLLECVASLSFPDRAVLNEMFITIAGANSKRMDFPDFLELMWKAWEQDVGGISSDVCGKKSIFDLPRKSLAHMASDGRTRKSLAMVQAMAIGGGRATLGSKLNEENKKKASIRLSDSSNESDDSRREIASAGS